jgi:hypothetical protein
MAQMYRQEMTQLDPRSSMLAEEGTVTLCVCS